MTYIVLGFVAVVAIIFVGVVIGKSIDKREEELIGSSVSIADIILFKHTI